ncbi:hypothetical protein KIPB_009878, partial [Kipferlia bialata]
DPFNLLISDDVDENDSALDIYNTALEVPSDLDTDSEDVSPSQRLGVSVANMSDISDAGGEGEREGESDIDSDAVLDSSFSGMPETEGERERERGKCAGCLEIEALLKGVERERERETRREAEREAEREALVTRLRQLEEERDMQREAEAERMAENDRILGEIMRVERERHAAREREFQAEVNREREREREFQAEVNREREEERERETEFQAEVNREREEERERERVFQAEVIREREEERERQRVFQAEMRAELAQARKEREAETEREREREQERVSERLGQRERCDGIEGGMVDLEAKVKAVIQSMAETANRSLNGAMDTFRQDIDHVNTGIADYIDSQLEGVRLSLARVSVSAEDNDREVTAIRESLSTSDVSERLEALESEQRDMKSTIAALTETVNTLANTVKEGERDRQTQLEDRLVRLEERERERGGRPEGDAQDMISRLSAVETNMIVLSPLVAEEKARVVK